MQIKENNGAHGLRKVETEATMLENGTPQFISLVKRGANRTPIRMAKSEEDKMKGQNALDLGLIGRSFKAEVTPTLQAVIVAEGNGDKLGETLKAAGLEVVSTKTEEGCDVIQFVENLSGNLTTIQLNDNVTVAVADMPDLKLETYPDSTNFVENIQKASFFPNLNASMRVLDETVYNIMYSADTKSEAAANIEAEFAAAGAYVSGLANALPETVFKFETVLAKNNPFVEAEDQKADDDTESEEEETEEEEVEGADKKGAGAYGKNKQKPKKKAKKSEDDDEDEGADPESKATDGDDPDKKGEQEDPNKALLASISGLIGDAVQPLAKELKTIKGEVDGLKENVQNNTEQVEEQVASLSQKADNALKAVRGTVVGGEPDDETNLTVEQQEQVSKVRKAEQDARSNGIEIY